MTTRFDRIARFFRPDGARIFAVCLLLLLATGLSVLQPWPIKYILDSVLGGRPLPDWLQPFLGDSGKERQILSLAVAVFLLAVGQGAISGAANYLAIGIGLRGLQRVRNEVFAALQKLSLRFHQNANSGDLIYRASWDTYAFQTLFQQGFVNCVSSGLTLLLMTLFMLTRSVELTALAWVTIPLLVLVIRFFSRKMTERGTKAQQADSAVTSHVQQSMAALPLIQAYTREDQEQARFSQQTAAAQERRLAQHGWELVYWLAIAVVFGFGTALIVWVGSKQVLDGRILVGDLWIFLAYLGKLYEPLNQLSHVGATVSGAAASAKRVFELLETPEEVKDKPDARAVIRAKAQTDTRSSGALIVRGELEFSDVAFGYDPARTVLSGITFRIPAGTSAALIGPSGVGKTTLMNLVPRFFDPVAGGVKLDGTDLRDLKLKDLRAQIAVVLQEPILLPTTVAENIGYGRTGATRAEIEQSAKLANAHDFISRMPQGYDTVVGDGAIRLSVGERQRLNLARAFLKDAPILLLDEPTSALDAESEDLVVASLERLMAGRTTLMIAHRLSTIRRVNQVIVLQEGQVAETGTHEELTARGGYYTRVTADRTVLT